MRQFLQISLLVFVLAGSVFAGDIPNDYTGEITNDRASSQRNSTVNTAVVEAITLMVSLLPLP